MFGGIQRWVHMKEFLWSDFLLSRFTMQATLEGHTGCVNTLTWNSTGTLLMSGSDDCRVCLWDCTGAPSLLKRVKTGHRRNIFSTCFVPERGDREAITCALDRTVQRVDLEAERSVKLASFSQFCSKLAFVPGSSSCFLSAGLDGHADAV